VKRATWVVKPSVLRSFSPSLIFIRRKTAELPFSNEFSIRSPNRLWPMSKRPPLGLIVMGLAEPLGVETPSTGDYPAPILFSTRMVE